MGNWLQQCNTRQQRHCSWNSCLASYKLGKLARRTRLGEADAFISHSWTDDPLAKWQLFCRSSQQNVFPKNMLSLCEFLPCTKNIFSEEGAYNGTRNTSCTSSSVCQGMRFRDGENALSGNTKRNPGFGLTNTATCIQLGNLGQYAKNVPRKIRYLQNIPLDSKALIRTTSRTLWQPDCIAVHTIARDETRFVPKGNKVGWFQQWYALTSPSTF